MVSSRPEGWIADLRRFARNPVPEQRCELCSAAIHADHRHLIELPRRRLLCCCQACAVLFGNGNVGSYRLVPSRGRQLPPSVFSLTDTQWESLQIPIDIAFFFKSTPASRIVALYPGPAGTTESALDLSAWEELQIDNPVLATLEPDVEALLINRQHGAREYYQVPIDRCYALAGIIRTHWRGLNGGAQAWIAIRAFFADLQGAACMPEKDFYA